LRDVSDQDDVEAAVVRAGFRREPHPATVPLAVRDDHVMHASLSGDAVLEAHGYLAVAPEHELSDERGVERHASAERLRHRVRAARDRAAHADARHVREPARALAEAHASEVDALQTSFTRNAYGLVERSGNPVRAHEVHSRPARD